MLHSGRTQRALPLSADVRDIVALLKLCAKRKDLERGASVHADILDSGILEKNCYVSTALVNMYAKCGALATAEDVIEELPAWNIVSWNALISAYAQQGQGEKALKCFRMLQSQGYSPNSVTFTMILKALSFTGAVEIGEQIHKELLHQDLLRNDVVLGNSLVDMYAKCGALMEAVQVLDELPLRNAVSWNALITGFVQWKKDEETLNCFKQMQHEGISPEVVTFISIVKACGNVQAVDMGEQIHMEIIRQGLLTKHMLLGTTLVDMYAKCGVLAKAADVLNALLVRDVVAWNALIAGYVDQEQNEEALKCFERMQREGISPDIVTLTCIVKACGKIGATDKGDQVHYEIIKMGFLQKDLMLGTALVDMYAKCGAVSKAMQLLHELPVQDVVVWNALITGWVQQEQYKEALKCFEIMQSEGFAPDTVTFACILKACGNIGAIDKGIEVHREILRLRLLGKDNVLGSALVHMYAKCGVLAKASKLLDELPTRNVVPWSILISGYAQHGQGEKALKCFEQMQCEGFLPDVVTLSTVFSACSRSGLMDVGLWHFACMNRKYGIIPNMEHHTCIVDLFARSGEFEKALSIIKGAPSSEHLPVWLAFLSACQESGNVMLGELAFNNAVQVDEHDSAAYVVMLNLLCRSYPKPCCTS